MFFFMFSVFVCDYLLYFICMCKGVFVCVCMCVLLCFSVGLIAQNKEID